jgi:L-aminopeptidase/D-esterase-like protein
MLAVMVSAQTPPADGKGLTAVAGLKVGHHTLSERPTGCTVILTEGGAVASVDVRGGAPGTRETALLEPVKTVDTVHAIVLSGGSAFGLAAADGVVRFLEERSIGYHFGGAVVPIVPAAILFDLGVGNGKIRPTAECGYQAAKNANDGPVQEGNVGAGAGATVGKAGGGGPMKAGLGTAAIALPDGLVVAALVAVNAGGDIIDPATGRVVAGARTADGTGLVDVRTLVRGGQLGRRGPRRDDRGIENTTLGVVATNATLTKVEAYKVAQMAHDGLARAISPAHGPGDGDTVFAVATGTRTGDADLRLIGALAAEVMADAIVRAATQATGIPGYPAARDLAGRR